MSDHSLEVKKSRHLKLEREKRECRLWNSSKAEDEIHFLFESDAYASQYELFINAIGLLY